VGSGSGQDNRDFVCCLNVVWCSSVVGSGCLSILTANIG
jgi:hypothetical protein